MDLNLYLTAQLQIILFEKKKIQIMVMVNKVLRLCLFIAISKILELSRLCLSKILCLKIRRVDS